MAGSNLWPFTKWREWAVGKLIDIDGWYGAQCWDAFADYAIRCAGAAGYEAWTSGNAGADTSLVSSIWLKFPARPGIEKRFRQVSRNETPRAGDVAIWARSSAFPQSHIGICTGRSRPGQIEVVSQNLRGSATSAAGAVSVDWLTTDGLLGYLRPSNSQDPTPTPVIGEEEDDDMANAVYVQDAATKGQGTVFRVLANGRKRAVPTPEWNAIRAQETAASRAGYPAPVIVGQMSGSDLSKIPNA